MKTLALALAVAVGTCFGASQSMASDESPMTVEGAKTVNSAEAKALFDKGAKFVDTRIDSDWGAGRIPGAVHIELKKQFTEESLGAAVKKDQDVVFYCNGAACLRASEACVKAVTWKYTNVYYYRDGFPGWKQAGYPVE